MSDNQTIIQLFTEFCDNYIVSHRPQKPYGATGISSIKYLQELAETAKHFGDAMNLEIKRLQSEHPNGTANLRDDVALIAREKVAEWMGK